MWATMWPQTEAVPARKNRMDKPLIGIDMDGVICRPPLGLNLPIAPGPHRERRHHPAHREPPRGLGLMALKLFLRLKYVGRQPLPGALEAVKAIGHHRTPILVTSRNAAGRQLIDAWLARHGFAGLIREVHANGLGLPSPDFKWHTCSRLGIEEFVDDDGRVADLLSRKGLKTVFLRDWPRNRGYDYLPNVTRVKGLAEVATILAAR